MPLTRITICSRCGGAVASDKLDGLCPACLLAHTLDVEDPGDEPVFWEDAPARKTPNRTFSHFELLDELGRGGMGVVYRARDLNTERIVALKVLQAHHLQVPDLVQRFRSEVRAVSSLDHPNVLPIHEVGEHDGIPFFSMKLTTGGSLAHAIGNYLGRPPEAARMLAKICRGVQHAHERGILHRDLKPGNILIDSAGEPYVCDFGLAKWLEDDRQLTMTAAVLGTPHYIAPEQASGNKGLTTAVDIYSLGAILYELLTGRPPFIGASVIETLVASQEKSPDRPSSLAKNVPRDLETICLKALQHDPGNRYPTAGAFADDLEAYLGGRPIQARPIGAAEQLWRWARRNPAAASLTVALVIALVLAAVVGTTSAIRIDQERKRAIAAEHDAKFRLKDSLLAQARAARLGGLAGQRTTALRAIGQSAEIEPSIEARNEAITALTLMDLTVDRAVELRDGSVLPMDFSGYGEDALVATHEGGLRRVNLLSAADVPLVPPTGQRIHLVHHSGTRFAAVVYDDGTIKVWSAENGAELFSPGERLGPYPPKQTLAFDHAETRLAICSPAGGVIVYDVRSGRRLAEALSSTVLAGAGFSPDDSELCVYSKGEPWHLYFIGLKGDRGAPRSTLLPARVSTIDWHPGGELLAVGSVDALIYIIDREKDTAVATLPGHRQPLTQVAFSHDGALLASTDRDRTIRLWNTVSWEQEVLATGYGLEPVMRFSRDDGTLFVTQNASKAFAMRVASSRRACVTVKSERDWATLVSSLSYSPSGRWLAAASFRHIQVWDTKRRAVAVTLPATVEGEKNLHFQSDTSLLVACRTTGVRRFTWQVEDGEIRNVADQAVAPEPSFIFGTPAKASGPFLALTSASKGLVRIMDAATGKVLREVDKEPEAWDAIVGPESRWLATSYSVRSTNSVRIRDLAHQGSPLQLASGPTATLALSPDGRYLVTAGEGETIVWDTETWQRITRRQFPEAGRATFSEDGSLLALCAEAPIHLVNTQTWDVVATLETNSQHLTSSYRLRFSPDGSQLVAQAYDNTLQFWDLELLQTELARMGLAW